MIKIDENEFRAVCSKVNSMAEAAVKLKLHFNTFRRKATRLGCYKPNQGLKNGTRLKQRKDSILLDEILEGKHPQYQTFKLKIRLLKAGLKENKCDVCGAADWRGIPLAIELHHVDGNRSNHVISNLQMICPNCHSQTATFRAKNKIEH
jgi:RNA polymerase subunit RPABC4/transcription elongation factor Spt4